MQTAFCLAGPPSPSPPQASAHCRPDEGTEKKCHQIKGKRSDGSVRSPDSVPGPGEQRALWTTPEGCRLAPNQASWFAPALPLPREPDHLCGRRAPPSASQAWIPETGRPADRVSGAICGCRGPVDRSRYEEAPRVEVADDRWWGLRQPAATEAGQVLVRAVRNDCLLYTSPSPRDS